MWHKGEGHLNHKFNEKVNVSKIKKVRINFNISNKYHFSLTARTSIFFRRRFSFSNEVYIKQLLTVLNLYICQCNDNNIKLKNKFKKDRFVKTNKTHCSTLSNNVNRHFIRRWDL